MKYLVLLLIIPFLPGCSLTQAGVVKELSQERTARYQAHLTAQSAAVASIVDALKSMDRGGMSLELADDGKVKSISYTETLNVDALTKMAQTQAYQEEPVQGVLGELGDFVLKATNLAVPVASIYYSSKNHAETQRANIALSDSSNQANTAMWGAFTSGYQNTSSTTATSVTDISNNVATDRNYSSDTTIERDFSDTTTISMTDRSDSSSVIERDSVKETIDGVAVQ